MIPKTRFLSPQTKYNLVNQRSLQSPQNLLQHYSSLKYIDKYTKPAQNYNIVRKKIQNYSYSSADCIGQGFTSKVYKAKKDGSDQIYAIKVVDLKKYSSNNREMLESQISIIKKMNHPNIIKCYDVYQTINNCYIITEYCEGGDLSNWIKKNRKSDVKLANKIFRDILLGFKYLAENNVVHRDIKPANIFFKSGTCKIADFGFAKKTDDLKNKQNYNVGTPLYMPPESLLHNVYSIKSDVFSVGIIFYEIIVGVSPWQSRNEKELVTKMTTTPLKFPPVFSKQLKQFIAGCLSMDIEKRYSIEAMVKTRFYQNLISFIEQITSEVSNKKINTTQILENKVNHKLLINEDQKLQKFIIDRNSTILLNQINLCRFMYYIVKNQIPHLKTKENRAVLNSTLFKHINKIMLQLSLNQNNHFSLRDYDSYKRTSSYEKVFKAIKQYESRYRLQSKQYSSRLDNQIQAAVEAKLQRHFRSQNVKNNQFYKSILELVKQPIGQLNYNINLDINLANQTDLRPSIQGFNSLIKYIKILRAFATIQNYEYFTDNILISVITDYSQSKITLKDYYSLNEQFIKLML